MHVQVSRSAPKYQPVGGRDASLLEAQAEQKSAAVASPLFGSIKLPPGVVLTFVRADGTVVSAANAR